MEYIIAVYRSRSVSIRAYNSLLSNGITCALVSTPRAAGVGCGLSVKFGRVDFARVRQVLSNAETFAGFFLIRPTLSGTVVTRI